MPRQKDEDTGRFTQVYTDEEFLEALRAIGPAGTSDIADEVGCDEKNAYRRLVALEDEGTVTSELVGNAKLWRIADGTGEINPEDPFWTAEPVAVGGPTDVAANADEYLYGPVEGEDE